MAETLNVNLGSRAYPIRFAAELAAEVRGEVAKLTAAGRKAVVLTDTNFAREQVGAMQTMFGDTTPVLVVEPGEGSKSLAGLGRVWDSLAGQKVDRGGALFA